MNYMKEIAQLLGVELGEEFKLKANGIVSVHNFRLTEHGLIIDDCDCKTPFNETLSDILTDLYDVVKLHEFPEPILDEKEKEYLSYVIKPFRNKIKYFFKFPCANGDYEAIAAVMKGRDCYDSLSFPKFKKGSMYTGMELIKEYSLDELGL